MLGPLHTSHQPWTKPKSELRPGVAEAGQEASEERWDQVLESGHASLGSTACACQLLLGLHGTGHTATFKEAPRSQVTECRAPHTLVAVTQAPGERGLRGNDSILYFISAKQTNTCVSQVTL
ncbi:hypothetical protein NDU88_004023 [Pleurodeles waltl]|uniref:Uncharacterized protein n=1 Tax=Pleurodeles waltl TaxID=8319 RepID=A0AAV7TRD2_PLEWA|nr:hypothetical protein NDU88_004023 [Pleurodeles waltl]